MAWRESRFQAPGKKGLNNKQTLKDKNVLKNEEGQTQIQTSTSCSSKRERETEQGLVLVSWPVSYFLRLLFCWGWKQTCHVAAALFLSDCWINGFCSLLMDENLMLWHTSCPSRLIRLEIWGDEVVDYSSSSRHRKVGKHTGEACF